LANGIENEEVCFSTKLVYGLFYTPYNALVNYQLPDYLSILPCKKKQYGNKGNACGGWAPVTVKRPFSSFNVVIGKGFVILSQMGEPELEEGRACVQYVFRAEALCKKDGTPCY